MEIKFLEFTSQFLLKIQTHGDFSLRKTSILLDLEQFASFVEVEVLGFHFDPKGPLPVTIKKP